MEKKIQIPAIHDKDLRLILDKFGLSERIDKGNEFCELCNKLITWENLFALKVVENGAIIFCDEPDCIDKSSS